MSTAEDPAPTSTDPRRHHRRMPIRAMLRTGEDLVLPDYDHLPAAHVVAKLASLTPTRT